MFNDAFRELRGTRGAFCGATECLAYQSTRRRLTAGDHNDRTGSPLRGHAPNHLSDYSPDNLQIITIEAHTLRLSGHCNAATRPFDTVQRRISSFE